MPFRFDTYDSPHTGSIADLMGRRAEIRANAARQSGDAQARAAEISGHGKAQMAGMIGQAGQQVVGGLFDMARQRQQAREQAPMQELAVRERLANIALLEQKLVENRATAQEAETARSVVKEAMAAAGDDPAKAAAKLLSEGWPELAKIVGGQAPTPIEVSPGASLVDPSTNQVTVTAPTPPPAPPAPPSSIDGAIIAAHRAGDQAEVSRLLALKRQSSDAGRQPDTGGAPERPSVWVAKGGEMQYVTPSQAAVLSQQGWKPGNNREQGRPVTSGDAGRIADLDTSLKDLGVLTSTVQDVAGATGVSAQIGANLPNWVTELTGKGATAKSKQAVIDRVKQVIGKALEGGVLRKEDEIKYAKILPTIGDVPEVVKTKLEGLIQAITQRRRTTLEALEDAGYDITKFTARTGATKIGNYEVTVDPN